MPYNRRYSDPIPYDDEGGGPTTRLIQSLIGIQDRKTQRARQAEMDRIAEEDRQRQIKAEDEDRALKFAEIQYRIAAEQNRPKETVDKTVATTSLKAPEPQPAMTPEEQALQDNTGEATVAPNLQDTLPDQPQGVPDELPLTIKEEIASPIPTQRLTMGGQTIDREMPDRGETMARQAEASRAAKLASGGVELTPEIIASMPEGPLRDVFQMFAGSIQQPPNMGSALAAQIRSENTPTRAENPEPVVIDGVETMATPSEIAAAKASGKKVVMARAPSGSGTTPAMKQYTDKRDGQVVFLNNADAAVAAKEGWLAPGPTSEMRNTSFQAGAVEPAFDLVEQSLNDYKRKSKGVGSVKQVIPGTNAYYAKDHYISQVKALLGAIVARQAGEGSRLSDEDRVAYSRAAGLVNESLMLPGGTAEARKRLNEARDLIRAVQQRRAISGAGSGAQANPPASSDAKPEWEEIAPGVRRKKK